MCIYAFCFSTSKIKIKKHLTNTISLFKRMQIITRNNSPRATEDRRWENQRMDSTEHAVRCGERRCRLFRSPYGDPKIQWDSGWKRERVREGWVGGRSRLSDGQFWHVSFASHWGLLGVVVFEFPHTLCPYEQRLSSLRRIRFREGRGTPGWTPSQCLSLGACSLAPWEEKYMFFHSQMMGSLRTCTWRPQL